jgi:hypothetical protein
VCQAITNFIELFPLRLRVLTFIFCVVMLNQIQRRVRDANRSLLGFGESKRASQKITSERDHHSQKVIRSDALCGLGVRDIPIYGFPVKDIPRLERGVGYRPINRILSPKAIRN